MVSCPVGDRARPRTRVTAPSSADLPCRESKGGDGSSFAPPQHPFPPAGTSSPRVTGCGPCLGVLRTPDLCPAPSWNTEPATLDRPEPLLQQFTHAHCRVPGPCHLRDALGPLPPQRLPLPPGEAAAQLVGRPRQLPRPGWAVRSLPRRPLKGAAHRLTRSPLEGW